MLPLNRSVYVPIKTSWSSSMNRSHTRNSRLTALLQKIFNLFTWIAFLGFISHFHGGESLCWALDCSIASFIVCWGNIDIDCQKPTCGCSQTLVLLHFKVGGWLWLNGPKNWPHGILDYAVVKCFRFNSLTYVAWNNNFLALVNTVMSVKLCISGLLWTCA